MNTQMNSTPIEHDETLEQVVKKNAYEPEQFACPQCRRYTLEYQVFGYVKEVFCTSSSCGYHETIEL